MTWNRCWCCAVLYLFLAAALPLSAQTNVKTGVPVPVQTFVPTAPTVFRGGGKSSLCYEIYFTNMSKDAWVLKRIQAMGEGATLLSLEGKSLEDTLRHPGRPDLKAEALTEIAPGERVIAFLWIDLAKAAPRQLTHTLLFQKSGSDTLYELEAGKSDVHMDMPTIVSPLKGRNWVAANGPSNTSDHRRSILVIGGTPHIAQRYAIDWVQVDDSGVTHKGNEQDNHSYFCFGALALAVADATVVEVKDGIPENTPGAKSLAVEITLETVAGNHVNLDLGNGVYAMYAHLQPGSLRVKVGDKVTRGQVLGLVGNTGNSTEPHLHFQLMNANSPLASEGLPYCMTYELDGHISGDKHPKVDRLPSPRAVQGEIPLEDDMVSF